MPNYKYTARDRRGNMTAGSIVAADEAELRRILRTNDLYLTKFKGGSGGAEEKKGAAKPGMFEPKVTLQDMVIATRQLGTTVRAGLPLMVALSIVGSQTNKPSLKNAFKDLEQGVSDGEFLSAGMRKHPKLFNRLVISLVEAGEVTGTLEETLDVAANQLDREDHLRRKVKAAMLYPKLVVAACIATIAGMLLLVVPVFSKVYTSLHADLPGPTVMLMALSDKATHYWWLAALIGAGISYLFKKYRETPTGQRRLDILVLKIPVLGDLLRKVAIARFVQTLSGSLHGGVPILQSLQISANTAGNTVIRDSVLSAAQNIRDGATIADELEKTQQFPMMVTRMIAAGEATGNIDTMLDEINRFYDRDIEYAVDKLTRMIEPLMTALVGTIVLFVLLALYMPIFTLGNAFLGKK